MNKGVLGYGALREAIGTEWRHKTISGVVHLLAFDAQALTVQITETTGLKDTWPIPEFLRFFKPAIPKDKVPAWYERLLADRLL
jgi:hypothetical protein